MTDCILSCGSVGFSAHSFLLVSGNLKDVDNFINNDLILFVLSVFTAFEHLNNFCCIWRVLSTKRFLVKHFKRKTTKDKVQRVKKWKWFHWSPHVIPKSSRQPAQLTTFTFIELSTASAVCMLHWVNHLGSQIKCWLNWKYSIPLASWKKNVSTPLTPPPPRAHPAFTSPPPPLVFRKQ